MGANTRTRMKKEDRREAILAEAIKAIGERGYHGFSFNDLAKRCKLTNAGLLHHFGSKEGLLVALLQERDRIDKDAVSAAVGPIRREEPLPLDACLALFRAIVARNVGQPEIIRLYAILRAEALVPDHPAFAFFRTREMEVMELFQRMIAALVPDSVSTARQILAQMNGLEIQWLRESRMFDLVEEWDKVARKLLSRPD